MGMGLERHIRPLQEPHPPIGVAGLSAPSPTLELAGEHGWIPLSLNLNPGYLSSHWDSVETGAARSGRTVSRRDWRTVREVFVAETDDEAWQWSVDNMMGRMNREYFLPLLTAFGFSQYLKEDVNDDVEVTVEYCAEHNWLIGSPETVAAKLEKVYDAMGGFGYLLLFCFDYADNPEPWRRSMELLATDVLPRVAHLTG
jgi:alkanesulfonate monooxygenase SsuD/methylene tetrahydromethanopterin reductase-like flavin-dependent oxidoreductase (luciferase family)